MEHRKRRKCEKKKENKRQACIISGRGRQTHLLRLKDYIFMSIQSTSKYTTTTTLRDINVEKLLIFFPLPSSHQCGLQTTLIPTLSSSHFMNTINCLSKCLYYIRYIKIIGPPMDQLHPFSYTNKLFIDQYLLRSSLSHFVSV